MTLPNSAEGKGRTTKEQTFPREESTLETRNRQREKGTETLESNAHHGPTHEARNLFPDPGASLVLREGKREG